MPSKAEGITSASGRESRLAATAPWLWKLSSYLTIGASGLTVVCSFYAEGIPFRTTADFIIALFIESTIRCPTCLNRRNGRWRATAANGRFIAGWCVIGSPFFRACLSVLYPDSEEPSTGVIDSYGIELIHPVREGRSPKQTVQSPLDRRRQAVLSRQPVGPAWIGIGTQPAVCSAASNSR